MRGWVRRPRLELQACVRKLSREQVRRHLQAPRDVEIRARVGVPREADHRGLQRLKQRERGADRAGAWDREGDDVGERGGDVGLERALGDADHLLSITRRVEHPGRADRRVRERAGGSASGGPARQPEVAGVPRAIATHLERRDTALRVAHGDQHSVEVGEFAVMQARDITREGAAEGLAREGDDGRALRGGAREGGVAAGDDVFRCQASTHEPSLVLHRQPARAQQRRVDQVPGVDVSEWSGRRCFVGAARGGGDPVGEEEAVLADLIFARHAAVDGVAALGDAPVDGGRAALRALADAAGRAVRDRLPVAAHDELLLRNHCATAARERACAGIPRLLMTPAP